MLRTSSENAGTSPPIADLVVGFRIESSNQMDKIMAEMIRQLSPFSMGCTFKQIKGLLKSEVIVIVGGGRS